MPSIIFFSVQCTIYSLGMAMAWKGCGAKINPRTGSAVGFLWLGDASNLNFWTSLTKMINNSALARLSPRQYRFPEKENKCIRS